MLTSPSGAAGIYVGERIAISIDNRGHKFSTEERFMTVIGKAFRSCAVAINLMATAALLFSMHELPFVDVANADGQLSQVQHVIIVMQENHSFDNYLGVLPYAKGTPYHRGPCVRDDHKCVDGLDCRRTLYDTGYECRNANQEARHEPQKVSTYHATDFCSCSSPDHGWAGTHIDHNVSKPNSLVSKNDGFVIDNFGVDENVCGPTVTSVTDDETMSFYNEDDVPFYYSLAETFAISDRYFSSALGPTTLNRFYLLAATSFGHLSEGIPRTNSEEVYMPSTGTIFDQLDTHQITWREYFETATEAYGGAFRDYLTDPNFRLVQKPEPNGVTGPFDSQNTFYDDAKQGTLPAIAFVDTSFGNSEHPETDIRSGQVDVARIVNAVRSSPNWANTIIFITWDENGGFYDHVLPPAASQGGKLSPDGINPGQCEDSSNPLPGRGAFCSSSPSAASALCKAFTQSGPYPANCANFNQLGFRVPFVAVSPFSKPSYVSHSVADHTSLLAFIEKRFFSDDTHLTERDAHASTLEDMFDFNHAPSLKAVVLPDLAQPPANVCR